MATVHDSKMSFGNSPGFSGLRHY